jgi:mannan endo-1,4-beta-mannosidase
MRTVSLLLLLVSSIASAADFVRVRGTGFERGGKPYRFLGANLWYGMNLGSRGPGGDRARLIRELDRLQALGVTNLRVLGASEGPDTEPWRIVPALQPAPGVLREELLEGLDFLLDEMGKRGMTAVVCLNNFWPWSGGMAQYLRWSQASAIPYPPPQPGGDWGVYQRYTARFYSDARAMALADEVTRRIVARHALNPVVMAWQLANEPRGDGNVEAFNRWIDRTSKMIKALAPRQLVTTGAEGETPWPRGSGMDFVRNHSYPAIDYATAHIWAQNWGWYDPDRAPSTYVESVAKMKAYLQDHADKARRLGKPLVVEEFGLSRDGNSHDPASPATYRDRYYREVFETALQAGVAGVNFWAWSGEGRPLAPYGGHWKEGHPFTGDPPHEAQGWYGVYSTDSAMLQILNDFARRLLNL